jgi:hypothetical protein
MCIEKTILNFGKYSGKSFNYALQKDREYCKWFLRNLDFEKATHDRKIFHEFLSKIL